MTDVHYHSLSLYNTVLWNMCGNPRSKLALLYIFILQQKNHVREVGKENAQLDLQRKRWKLGLLWEALMEGFLDQTGLGASGWMGMFYVVLLNLSIHRLYTYIYIIYIMCVCQYQKYKPRLRLCLMFIHNCTIILTSCSRMRSKGSRFTLGVWGLSRLCSPDFAQPCAPVRVRPIWPCLWRVLQKWSVLEVSKVA